MRVGPPAAAPCGLEVLAAVRERELPRRPHGECPPEPQANCEGPSGFTVAADTEVLRGGNSRNGVVLQDRGNAF